MTDVVAPVAPESLGTGLVTARGETTIAQAVVEKIAGRAAVEVPEVGSVSRTGLRRLFSRGDDEAGVDAHVRREEASVELTISVRYPESVAEVAGRVRQHVRARVKQLTGLEVPRIAITVAELTTESGPAPLRVQ